MQSISLAEFSTMDRCPECREEFVCDNGEFVCKGCGIVKPNFEPYIDSIMYQGRSIQSYAVYGGSLGTNIASAQRGADGSSSESFALKGDNGRFKPITYVMQPWDLLRVVEPDAKIRSMKEHFAHIALKRGIDEIKLSMMFAPILKVAKQIQDAEEHCLIDAGCHESNSVKDTAVFCTPSSMNRRLRDFLQNLYDNFPEE